MDKDKQTKEAPYLRDSSAKEIREQYIKMISDSLEQQRKAREEEK